MSLIDLASLVLAPTATKEGKVYSAIPDTGDGDMTFTRGSAATRVNSAGLIEKERGNLLLQSNTFDTTWSTINTSVTSGQSGYDGSSDAWLITKSASSARVEQSITQGGVQTYSVYAKAGTLDFVMLNNGVVSQWYDLSNGTIGTNSSISNTIDAKIEDVGNGWYRCSLIFNLSITVVRIYPSQADNDVSGTSGNILIQDAMLNVGLVAQSYIETTTSAVYEGITDNVPRVDYSGGGCPSLLLEPSRTQLLTHSEYFDDWLSNRLDRTANSIISPEGVQNAYKMAQQSGFTTAPNINVGGIAAGTYTISIFAKKGSWNYLAISFQGVSYFNLETGSKGTINSNHTATIEDYGNGWYRCAITRTTTTTQTPAFYFAESDNTLTTPDTQGYMYTYGAMYEAGSYVSSYINSYGTSTTRVADSCSKTGISELIGQSEGTLYLEFKDEDYSFASVSRGLSISDGTYNNRIYISQLGGGGMYVIGETGGTADVEIQESDPSGRRGTIKAALSYSNNNYVLYVNGSLAGSDTSGNVPACSNVYLGQEVGLTVNSLNKPYNQVLLFKTRLTNTELAELTKL